MNGLNGKYHSFEFEFGQPVFVTIRHKTGTITARTDLGNGSNCYTVVIGNGKDQERLMVMEEYLKDPAWRRSSKNDAPKCDACGKRMLIGSTSHRRVYYYPSCKCESCKPVSEFKKV